MDLGATHILSLLGIEGAPDTPHGIDPARHLHIEVDDVPAPFAGDIVPTMEHIQKILEFSSGWDRQGPMIAHCYAGVSRSTAAALVILCHYNPGREMDAAMALRRAAPHAGQTGNLSPLLTGLWDWKAGWRKRSMQLGLGHTRVGRRRWSSCP